VTQTGGGQLPQIWAGRRHLLSPRRKDVYVRLPRSPGRHRTAEGAPGAGLPTVQRLTKWPLDRGLGSASRQRSAFDSSLSAGRGTSNPIRQLHLLELVAGWRLCVYCTRPDLPHSLARGEALPRIPERGFHSDQEIARLPGARRLDAGGLVPGPSGDVYAFSRATILRNLYRIPIS
jgi:hypothetical protein